METKPALDWANWRREALAGITTFFTMAYIVVVNPSILATEGTGLTFSGVLTATVALATLMTLAMGLYARIPFAVAPGMGLNAFFTYSIVLGQGVPWQKALGAVFWAGVFFLVVSATPLRYRIATAIPDNLRKGAAAGIGLFITFIGLRNMGIVVADPATFVKAGPLETTSLLSIAGFSLIVFLLKRKHPAAFIIGILTITAAATSLGLVHRPERLFSLPDFRSTFFQLDVAGALSLSLLPAMISILFTDLFDSISTFVGVSHATGLLDENGNPRRVKEGLLVDAFATLGGGLFGTSPGTAYIESASGIESGGRSGLTSVFTALCFVPCLFLAPVVAMVPSYATGPVLVLVGSMMFRSIGGLRLEHLEETIPTFLSVILIPLTFSITQGMLWGFASHVALHAAFGRGRDVSPMMYGIGAVSVFLLALESWPR